MAGAARTGWTAAGAAVHRSTRGARRHFAAALVLVGLAIVVLAGCGGRGDGGGTAFDPDSIPEAYRHSTAALMWPGATRAFQIRPDGDLFNGVWRVRIAPAGGAEPAGPPRVIAYEERWRPVARWRRRSGAVRWDFEAVALPGPGARDSGLVVSLRVRATNEGRAPADARLVVDLVPPDSAPPFVAADAGVEPLRLGPAAATDTVHAWSVAGGAPPWTLAPGTTREARFLLPAYPAAAADLEAWGRVPHERRAGEARRAWNAWRDEGTRFELGDPEVERALDAARLLMLASWERRGDAWVPIGSPLHYRDVWLRDGARVIAALAASGHRNEARAMVSGLLHYQWPPGAFMSQRNQLDGTGQALWAMEQALLRGAPADTLAPFAEAALRAVRWCERQRDTGRATGRRFGAMLPFSDPRDNELAKAQLVGNDAWALAGYASAARLLRAAGRPADAEWVEAARARYAGEFRAALTRTGSRDVPPSWQGVGRDWGNLSVMWPTGAISPYEPRLKALARRVWANAGGAGLGIYGPTDSLHYYLGADLGTWALRAGWRAEADSVLAAMLHWRSASGGMGEIWDRHGDYGRNLPPHGTSAAALVQLVRNALVLDEPDTLWLTLGARAPWWRGARLRGAPTRWGTMDLGFRRAGDAAVWTWSSAPVVTVLALPPGTRVAEPLPAPLSAGPLPGTVVAPAGTRRAEVRLTEAAR